VVKATCPRKYGNKWAARPDEPLEEIAATAIAALRRVELSLTTSR
jgi:hypothetical protein